MVLKIIVAIAIIVACVFIFPQKIFSQQQNQTVSGNGSKSVLSVPSNVSRIEITLKTDQSGQKSSLDIIVPAVAAIAGTGIGSFMTYFLTKRIEDQKAARAKQEEDKFSEDFKNVVLHDLEIYNNFLDSIREQHLVTREIIVLIDQLPEEPAGISAERKMAALGGTTLAKVESAYSDFHEFCSALKNLYRRG